MDIEGIGKRLRAERERLQLSQEQLAAIAGTNRITPSRYEGGTHLPTIAFLAAIEGAGVDIGFVLDGRRNIVALGPDDTSLLGRAVVVVDDLLAKHSFSPSEDMRGRLILQVLRDAQSSAQQPRVRTTLLEKLIADQLK